MNDSNTTKSNNHREREKNEQFNYHILVEMCVVHRIQCAIRCTRSAPKRDMNHVHTQKEKKV